MSIRILDLGVDNFLRSSTETMEIYVCFVKFNYSRYIVTFNSSQA